MDSNEPRQRESADEDRQAEIVRSNAETVQDMQSRLVEAGSAVDHVADGISKFAGSTWFVVIHAIWFAIWILAGSGVVPFLGFAELDPYPFSLLTLIVSLEAIFLSTFVLISQNKLAAAADRRSDLDLHINLLAEQKAAKTLELLGQITAQLNAMANEFKIPHDEELEALKESPEPADIVDIIDATNDSETRA